MQSSCTSQCSTARLVDYHYDYDYDYDNDVVTDSDPEYVSFGGRQSKLG